MKKRMIALLLCLTLTVSLAGCQSQPEATALDRATAWVEDRISENNLFTFAYNGQEMAEHIGQWEKSVEQQEDRWTVTYRLDGLKAWAELSLDREYAALDWCAYFVNEGSSDAKPVSDIQILDAPVGKKNAVMTSTVGSNAEETDFMPFSVNMKQEGFYSMASAGGRSSSTAWPYFDLCTEGQGVMGALGWTGNWRLIFENRDNSTHVTGGMVQTDIALHPQEQMRTPSMILLFFDGDQDLGHNQLRRLILKSYTPARNGEILTVLPTFTNNWGGLGITSHMVAVGQMEGVGAPFEGLWIDAGWYNAEPSDNSHDTAWYRECGSWTFNEELYPEGLTPLGEYLAEDHKDLMLWFEIERAMEGTDFLKENEDYFLPKNESDAYRLYDMGDSQAREYLIGYLAEMFKENGITCYRQDFNVSPANTWSNADALEGEHRVGINEIHYITGLYAFFDGLYEAIPGLMIDNCASGGRRLDIEMMRRSVAYWPTDFLTREGTVADDARNINYSLRWWLPVFAYSASREGRTNDYQLRSMYANGVSVGTSVSDRTWYLHAMEDLYDFRRFLTDDYYILAGGYEKQTMSLNAAYEFYLRESGEGRVLIFRPRASDTATQTYLLKGLEAGATYDLEITDTGTTMTATGQELMEKGLRITLDDPNTSVMITLQKQ